MQSRKERISFQQKSIIRGIEMIEKRSVFDLDED